MEDATAHVEVSDFQNSISDLFDFLKQSSTGNLLLDKLDSFDNYLMSHSTNVCYLSLLLGMKLERYLIEQRSSKSPRDAKDLKELGLGALLHDVGKMRVPQDILNKPGRLDPEEMEAIKLHPRYGYQMVKGRVLAGAAQVVLNHHQRFDGKGYPNRTDVRTGEPLSPIAGQRIPIFCRIATICDVYDAATSERVYSPAKLPVQVLHEMRTWCKGFFDPVVEQAFRSIIPPFPLGQVVQLSNGCEAVVVDFNPGQPSRPKVQCLRAATGERFKDPSLEEIDLAMYVDVSIVAVDGVDVRPFMDAEESAEVSDPLCV
jgi:HD-GYP domain-containing protein (c-di-GMP phosphodiesterase class II)